MDDQASRLADGGGSLTEAVSGFVAAREPFLAELAGLGRRRSLDPGRLADLYGDASALLDRLLLRFIETHQRPGGPGRALIDAPRSSSPALTAVLALVFSAALFDQWRERRGGFQLIWGFGMLFYGIAAGCEALAGLGGWNEALYRTWYLTGAVWTAGWLGLGTAFLLGRTRFGYSFALCLFLAGLFTFLVPHRPEYPGPARPRCCTSSLRASSHSPWPSRPTSRTSAGRRSPRVPWSGRPSSGLVLMATIDDRAARVCR